MEKNLYNKVVFFYDHLAKIMLGNGYRQSKWAFLEEIRAGQSVLYIGGGTAENLSQIAQRVGESGKIYFAEASDKMIAKAINRLSVKERRQVVFLHQADFSLLPNSLVDVVITQYLLDILEDQQIDELFEVIGKRTLKNSLWIHVDFYDHGKWLWMQWVMITFFRLATRNPRKDLPKFDSFFAGYGWKREQVLSFKSGWIKASLFRKT